MPVQAQIPDVGLVEFPDGTTPEEISDIVNKHYGKSNPLISEPDAATSEAFKEIGGSLGTDASTTLNSAKALERQGYGEQTPYSRLNQKAVESASMTDSEMENLVPKALATPAAVAERALANVAGGFSDPENLVWAPMPANAAKGFLAQMGASGVKSLIQGALTLSKGEPEKAAQQILEGGANLVLPAIGLRRQSPGEVAGGELAQYVSKAPLPDKPIQFGTDATKENIPENETPLPAAPQTPAQPTPPVAAAPTPNASIASAQALPVPPEGFVVDQTVDEPAVNVVVEELPDGFKLSAIGVPKELQGKGAGSAAIRNLISKSDATGKPIFTTAHAQTAELQPKLNQFYERLGFKQFRTDPLSGKPMYRYDPKPAEAPVAPNDSGETSIKNEVVDQERAKRGLPPAMAVVSRDFPTVAADAAKRDSLDSQDPQSTDALIEELDNKPRALTDTEDAMLLRRQVTLQNEFDKVNDELVRSGDSGQSNPEAQLRRAYLSHRLYQLYEVGKTSGTETGRGLNARKMMANEDYSLAKMEVNKRAANGGRPLTDSERAELQAAHEKIKTTQKALDDHIEDSRQRISKLESDAALNDLGKDVPRTNPKILEVAKRIVDGLDKRADAARIRLKERLGRTSAGLDPTLLADLADIGASHLGHAALDFTEWSAKMASELGEALEKFKPHAQEIYEAAKERITKATSENPLELARAMREKSPEEQISANSDKIGEKVKAGKRDEITWHVQRIARLLLQSGLKDREALIDRVHGILQKSLPDITRRETMDAISGYGDFKQLSKDKISVELRGLKGEMQQLAKLEDMGAGKPPLKSGVERRQQTEAERQLIKKVNEAKFSFQVPMTDPATQIKSALDTYKTSLRNRMADLQDRIDRGDYAKRPRRELQLDNEALRLKAENARVKQQFQQGLNRDRLKQRTPYQKVQDAVVKWGKGFLLSGPRTLAKLTAMAAQRAISTPLEEAVGAAYSKVPFVKQAFARAPREGGGMQLRAEVKAITEGIVQGSKDAWQVLRTGHGPLDLVYGKDPGLPQSFVDIFGNIHGALKAPVKRAEFARSFEKRAQFYADKGIDITDEFVQTRIGLEAYQDAERAIFMQKNLVNDMYKRALGRADQPLKETGKPSAGGQVAGTTLRTLLPIVKIPTNIVVETVQYAIGTLTGSTRLAMAFRKGIEELKPEEADLIARHLKKGSIGAAVMLAAFLNPKILGGFYQQGKKPDKNAIPPDAARVGGVTIPATVLEHPLVKAAQIAATVRMVAESKLRKKDKSAQGLGAGALAGAIGLADSVPFVREMTEVSKLMNPYERGQWINELIKSRTEPQLLQSIAQGTDKDAKGNPVKRKPEGLKQTLESGIPGLRQNVPVATK